MGKLQRQVLRRHPVTVCLLFLSQQAMIRHVILYDQHRRRNFINYNTTCSFYCAVYYTYTLLFCYTCIIATEYNSSLSNKTKERKKANQNNKNTSFMLQTLIASSATASLCNNFTKDIHPYVLTY